MRLPGATYLAVFSNGQSDRSSLTPMETAAVAKPINNREDAFRAAQAGLYSKRAGPTLTGKDLLGFGRTHCARRSSSNLAEN